MLEAARFRVLDRPRRAFMPPPGVGQARLRPGMLLSRTGRDAALLWLRGDPHAAVIATPA
jgi:hypothetical protein